TGRLPVLARLHEQGMAVSETDRLDRGCLDGAIGDLGVRLRRAGQSRLLGHDRRLGARAVAAASDPRAEGHRTDYQPANSTHRPLNLLRETRNLLRPPAPCAGRRSTIADNIAGQWRLTPQGNAERNAPIRSSIFSNRAAHADLGKSAADVPLM